MLKFIIFFLIVSLVGYRFYKWASRKWQEAKEEEELDGLTAKMKRAESVSSQAQLARQVDLREHKRNKEDIESLNQEVKPL